MTERFPAGAENCDMSFASASLKPFQRWLLRLFSAGSLAPSVGPRLAFLSYPKKDYMKSETSGALHAHEELKVCNQRDLEVRRSLKLSRQLAQN